MTDADSNFIPHCSQSEEIAAYLDGELEAAAAARFEQHLQACARCVAALQEQRRLLCTLDFAFGGDPGNAMPLPKNFSQIVTAHAQSNLCGLRSERKERRRAVRLCLALTIVSFALLGGAAISDSVLKPLGSMFRNAGVVLGFAARAFYDAGAGLAVVGRAVGGRTIFESSGGAVLACLLLAVAMILLPRLISDYHRTHIKLKEAAPRR